MRPVPVWAFFLLSPLRIVCFLKISIGLTLPERPFMTQSNGRVGDHGAWYNEPPDPKPEERDTVMRFASFLFITLAAVPAACVDQHSDEPEAAVASEIESANRTFEGTFARGDADGMAALYTEDGQLLPTGSDVISGRFAIAEFWQSAFDAGLARAELTTVELDSAGDVAYEVGRYRLSLPDGQVADEGKYVVLWKREDGRWKLHRDIWNTNNAPPEDRKSVV